MADLPAVRVAGSGGPAARIPACHKQGTIKKTHYLLRKASFEHSDFGNLYLFRISIFEFRISPFSGALQL